jgi:hypothetical protein
MLQLLTNWQQRYNRRAGVLGRTQGARAARNLGESELALVLSVSAATIERGGGR